MEAALGTYDLTVVWIQPDVGEWRVICHRCGLEAQTSRLGPYTECFDLSKLIEAHLCDPGNKSKANP